MKQLDREKTATETGEVRADDDARLEVTRDHIARDIGDSLSHRHLELQEPRQSFAGKEVPSQPSLSLVPNQKIYAHYMKNRVAQALLRCG